MANRNEYLQSLNRMRRNYQTGGNAVVNPSDDSTNVGEELSSFAYANTNPSRPEEPTDKDKGNILTRPIDTVESGIENVQRGLLGVIDDASDFLINIGAGIGKLFGADDEWAKQATQYNWVDRALEFENLTTGFFTNIYNGKLFSGEYGEAWDNLLNSKGPDFKGVLSESQRRGSITSDMGGVGDFIENIEQGIGGMLPALAIGDLSGGLGLGARIGIQAGMSGVEAYGAGIEKAYSEGAGFGEANAYGAIKGTIGAGTTAVLMGLGGYASSKGGEGVVGSLSSKLGDKILKMTGSHGSQAFATAVAEAVGRAGTTFATSMANQAVEPYIQSIYDNGKAIEEAYGSNKRITQYLQRCSVNAGTSALVTGIVTLGREGVELASRGKEGYMARFSLQKAQRAQQKIEKELKSINKGIENGSLTEKQVEARLASLGKYSNTVEEYGKLTAEYLSGTRTYSDKDGQFYSVGEYKGKNSHPDFESFGKNEDTAIGFYRLLKSRLQTNGNVVLSDDSFVKPDESGKGGQLVLTHGDATHSIAIKEQGDSYVVNARDLLVPACSGKTMDSTKPIALAGNALSPARVRNLAEIADKGDKNGAYVLESKQGGEYKAVIPTEDGKFGVITVDSKTNEIKDAEVKDSISSTGYNIVPREDVEKVKSTKAVSRKDGQPLFVGQEVESGKFGKDSYELRIYGHNDYSKKGNYVYAENPFYASDYKKALSFDKVSKEFGIPESLKETYKLKMGAGYDKLSNYLSDFTNLKINEITERLGYDVYIDEQKGEMAIKDASRIIKGGILDGNEKGSDGNVRVIGRDARDNSIEGLRGYLGENGEEIGRIQQRLDYSQKIRDGGLYKTKKISNKVFNIIDDEYLTKEMREMVDFGRSVGVEVNYAVGYEGKGNALGMYFPESERIVVFTDYLKNTSVFGLTKHEICHHAFAQFMADYSLHLTSQLYAVGKKSWTVQTLIDKYRLLYKDVPFSDPLEEIICQLYSGNEALPSQLSKYQNSIVNRVNEIFKENKDKASEEYWKNFAKGTGFSVEEPIDNAKSNEIESKKEPSDEFRQLQESSRKSLKDGSFRERVREIDENVRGRLSRVLGEELERRGYGNGNGSGLLDLNGYKVLKKVDGDTFHDIFEIAKAHLPNGELVDLHEAEDYKDTYNYLSKDGTSGFVITKEGDLISVFNASGKKGWLRAIEPIVREKAKTLDCFISPKQNLMEMYGNVFGFKTASIMDWNQKQDHDDIGKNHGEPKVAFMLKTSNEVVTKEFGKDDYDKALHYRNSLVRPSDRQKIISDLQAKSSNVLIEAGADVSKPVKYRIDAIGQALIKVTQSVLGEDSKVKLIPSETKQTFAELNLARPKDRHIAIDNAVKGLLSSKVELDGEKYVLRDLITAEQLDKLKLLVNINLQGVAEPTKIAQWAEALHLSKLENKENIRGAKLLSAISKKIDNSLNNTFGYGDVATGELTVYKNITDGIKPFFDNKSITELADRVLVNYTEDNLSKMYDSFGISYNPLIPQLAQMIKDRVVAGQHLDAMVRRMGNDILQLLKNDLDMVAQGSHDAKVKTARANVDIAQGIFYGNGEGPKNKFIGKIVEASGKLDASITAPSPFVHAIFPESPLDKHFGEVASEYENREIAKRNELLDYLFKGTNGGEDITKELGKKFEFKGEKITYAYALKQLNVQRTLGDEYYKVKGAVTNANGTRGEIKYDKEDIEELKSLIPQKLLDWNERFVKEGLNGKVKEFTKERYKAITKTELPTLDEEGKDWYHISRVTDKALPQKGGSRGNTPDLSYLSKRVRSVADLNLDGDLITDTDNYITKLVKDLTWFEWVQETNVMLNQRIYGTTLNAIMQKNVVGWDEIVDLTYHQILGIPYENTSTLFGKVFAGVAGNIAKANVLGLQTAIRTISSAPWFASYFGAKTSLAGGILSLKHGGIVNAVKRNSKIIKENSPYLKDRLEGNEVISAETSQRMSSKLSKLLGTPMRITDGYIVVSDFGFSCAQAQAMDEGFGDPYTKSNNERAVKILEEAVKKSQPTNSVLNVGGFRYGQYGQVTKLTFGMYASQIQSFFTGIRNAIIDIFTANKKIKNLEASIAHHKDREDFYKKQEEEHLKDLDEAETEEEYKEAEKNVERDRWKQEEHRQARESQEDYLKGFKAKHAGKAQFNKVIGTVSGLLGSALGYVLLNRLIQIAEGKKSIKDWDGIVGETAEQAVFKSIPYISTIYYAIKNDSDLSVFTIDNLNSLIDSCKGVVDAINSGDGGHMTGASINALKNIAMYFGIPAKSVWKIFNGLWYSIDKESNLSFNEWMGYLSSNQLRSRYQEAVKKGDKATAKANLEVWAYNYSSKASEGVIDEIYRLNSKGYTGITPVGIARTYTDEKGEKHAYASAQINAFKEAYAKADREMLALIRSGSYQSLDDEYKAKAVSSLYSYYNEYAKARRDGLQVSSKIGKLLEATNGDIDLAKYIAGLKEIGNITETRRGTRKENVIKAINRMSGFTKGERLLLAYLGGYSVSEGNRQILTSQLMRLGFDRKSALAYIS